MVRIAIPIWLLTASLASAQQTTVWLTILGRDGTEEVEIGPEGGLVPYRLFVETDPVDTPGNAGLSALSITVETNLGRDQQPPHLDPSFTRFFAGRGATTEGHAVDPDDLEGIAATHLCSGNGRPPCIVAVGIGQSGPQPVARGQFIVPQAPIGSRFRAKILLDRTSSLFPTSASVHPSVDFRGARTFPPVRPDQIVGNALTISVVTGPPLPADFDRDGDVDLADFLHLTECVQGAGKRVAQDCDHADLDGDGDVDLADVVSLMGMYTGGN